MPVRCRRPWRSSRRGSLDDPVARRRKEHLKPRDRDCEAQPDPRADLNISACRRIGPSDGGIRGQRSFCIRRRARFTRKRRHQVRPADFLEGLPDRKAHHVRDGDRGLPAPATGQQRRHPERRDYRQTSTPGPHAVTITLGTYVARRAISQWIRRTGRRSSERRCAGAGSPSGRAPAARRETGLPGARRVGAAATTIRARARSGARRRRRNEARLHDSRPAPAIQTGPPSVPGLAPDVRCQASGSRPTA